MSANVSFLELLSDASIIATLSFAISTVAGMLIPFRSTASDTVPLVPPPESPSPSMTPCISPTCPLIVSVPQSHHMIMILLFFVRVYLLGHRLQNYSSKVLVKSPELSITWLFLPSIRFDFKVFGLSIKGSSVNCGIINSFYREASARWLLTLVVVK